MTTSQTSRVRNSISRPPLRRGFLLIPLALALAWLALAPAARADCRNGCDNLFNTFLGNDALFNNTTGQHNTAIGQAALFTNDTGSDNAASGFRALDRNADGFQNTANGSNALFYNITGFNNTANGAFALQHNTTDN